MSPLSALNRIVGSNFTQLPIYLQERWVSISKRIYMDINSAPFYGIFFGFHIFKTFKQIAENRADNLDTPTY